MEETRKDRIQLLVRRICLIITDILLVNGCVFLSLLMRFEIRQSRRNICSSIRKT